MRLSKELLFRFPSPGRLKPLSVLWFLGGGTVCEGSEPNARLLCRKERDTTRGSPRSFAAQRTLAQDDSDFLQPAQDGGVKLIVGLGNPGIEYQFTPHNLGFLAVDRIAGNLGVEVRNRQCRALTGRAVIGDQTVLLAKPETFMNLSGLS